MDVIHGERLRAEGDRAVQVWERRPGPVTIYDVARVAGVASSTVSRALVRPGLVNADTAARIRRVAEDLGYRARPVAQAPVTDRSRLLGLLVSDITDPSFGRMIRAAHLAAAETGHEILLVDSRESAARERNTLERLLPLVEGFVIASSRMSDSALRTIAKQRPTVVLNRAVLDVRSVVTDDAGGARAAVELLHDLGHDAATYVAGPAASWADGVRFRSLRDYGTGAGVTITRLGPFLPTFEGGLAAARVLAGRTPTAIVAYNDVVAAGLIQGLLGEGFSIPDDVSVIGFDDILISRISRPTLTTVAAPARELGTAAVRKVVALIGGEQHHYREPLVLPVQLRVRGSTARHRRRRRSPVSFSPPRRLG
jgi:LacI family transcriptional regulator